MSKLSNFHIKGMISPTLTPFKDNEELDLDKIKAYVDHHIKFGVRHVFVCGSSGEAPHLTLGERKLVAEAWMREGRDKFENIIVHVGASNVKDSMELAKHAEQIGADAIASVGPTYFLPQTLDDYVEYMRRIASAAPNTPFLLYDLRNITGITFGANDFFHAARKVIPTLRGMKHTTEDFHNMHLTHIEHREAGIQVIPGSDEWLLQGLAMGMDSVVGASFNGLIDQRMIEAFERGDMEGARREQEHIVKVVKLRKKHGLFNVSGTRAIVKLTGLDLGPPTLPLPTFSPETEEAFKKDMEAIGFFEWGCK